MEISVDTISSLVWILYYLLFTYLQCIFYYFLLFDIFLDILIYSRREYWNSRHVIELYIFD